MRILVIEDRISLAKSLQKILQSEKYVVDIEHDGSDGLMMAEEGNYDLLVIDLGLPSMDGLAITRQLRTRHINTPILILTARDLKSELVQGLDSGADDYLTKPFDSSELLARIRALLRREAVVKTPELQVADLMIDPATQTVTRGGKTIDLSQKEFMVLQYLLRHPGRVISKSELLDHVWADGGEVFDRVVDTYIYYLRQKIDKPFINQPALIITVKGRGYKIAAPTTALS